MDGTRSKSTPTPEEIAAACEEIQAAWTPAERLLRPFGTREQRGSGIDPRYSFPVYPASIFPLSPREWRL